MQAILDRERQIDIVELQNSDELFRACGYVAGLEELGKPIDPDLSDFLHDMARMVEDPKSDAPHFPVELVGSDAEPFVADEVQEIIEAPVLPVDVVEVTVTEDTMLQRLLQYWHARVTRGRDSPARPVGVIAPTRH
jgi:hypothetical protein